VYCSAFSPIPHSSARLPNRAPPLVREHRLYQADWLLRYYGFSKQELVQSMPSGQLDLGIDPKTAWALANRQCFPVDVNSAERTSLLRVPGMGVRVVDRILSSRRHRSLKRARFFIAASDYSPPHAERGSERIRSEVMRSGGQLPLF